MAEMVEESMHKDHNHLLRVNNYLDIFQELILDCNGHSQHYNVLQLEKYDYFSLVDSNTILWDAQRAINSYKKYGIRVNLDQSDDGESFLRFYGLMNACYLQREAIITCYKKLGIGIKADNLDNLKKAQIIDCRNKFAAHSPSVGYEKNKNEHSYILSKTHLDHGVIFGNSLNSPEGSVTFPATKITDMLDNWESLLEKALEDILDKAFELLCDQSYFQYIKDKFYLAKNKKDYLCIRL